MLATFNSIYQMRVNKVHRFRPKIEIEKKIGSFLYKTVTTTQELREVFALRYQVFHRELIGKDSTYGLDIDAFDAHCDHLIIIDTKKNMVVGTYRLNCSNFSNKFYSSQEFVMNKILSQPGTKLELGRACIHQDYRRGFVISMLWKGIIEYMVAANAEWLFGCATVKTENPREAALLYRYFIDEDRINPEFFTPPTLPYTMPNLNFWIPRFSGPLNEAERAEAEALLPGLCRAYLNMGALVGGEPAYDAEFNCIDFLTILRKSDLNGHLWRRMGGEKG